MPLRDESESAGYPTRQWWVVSLVALAVLALLISTLLLVPIGMPVREQIGSLYVCGLWGIDAVLAPSRGSTYAWEFGAAVYARPGVHSSILPVRSGYADREWTLRFGRLRWAIVHFPRSNP